MKILKFASALLLSSILFTACSKDKNGKHQIEVRMTDAPFNAEEVNVDIRQVQVHFTNEDNTGWYDMNTTAKVYNLLALQNGVDVMLASGAFAESSIKEIRLVLGSNNSIKIAGVTLPLTIPSGSESGLKIKVDKSLSQSVSTTVLLDFDAGLSIHQTGNGSFTLRPVIMLK